ncbi:hypothetical protein ACF0H5_018795 [Mactra antiquata]
MISKTSRIITGFIICIFLISNVLYLKLYEGSGFIQNTVRAISNQDLNNASETNAPGAEYAVRIAETAKSEETKQTTVFPYSDTPITQNFVTSTSTSLPVRDYPYCKFHTSWNTFLMYPTTLTDFTNWNLTELTSCNYGNILSAVTPSTNFRFSLNCSDGFANPLLSAIKGNKSNDDIQIVEFGDKCLLDFIENCCYDTLRVPNVVHYVMYNKERLSFFEFVSLYSVIRFVRPCAILIHGDHLPSSGSYWEYIRAIYPNIIQVRRSMPVDIFGQKRKFREHSGDIMRIEALIEYGGLYFDLDTLVVKPIDSLRSFPCAMSAQSSGFMSSAFIASERNSSFIFNWLEGYRTKYKPESYTYNAMTYPRALARRYPQDIKTLYGSLSRPWYQIGRIIYETNYNWQSIYGIHLFSRIFNRLMNEEGVKTFNSTVGSICRHILYGNKALCRT